MTRFDYRKPNNPDTEYRLSSNGQVAVIHGTQGAITQGPDNGAIFQVTDGAIGVEASSGDYAIVEAGEIAIASDNGLIVLDSPVIEYRSNDRQSRSQYFFKDGLRVWVNGKPIESGDWVWHPKKIRIEDLMGEGKTRRIRRWPHYD